MRDAHSALPCRVFLLPMPVDHYENFPVASFLLPARLRKPVQIIYAFARSADDIADEGDAPDEQRLAALQAYRMELTRIQSGLVPEMPLFRSLATVIRDFELPLQPFFDLLSAFSQDIVVTRYDDFPTLLDYCKRSADPVGQLMLHLYQSATTLNLHEANAICSALQLINFCQDVAVDWEKQRIYLPREDMSKFGIHENDIAQQICTPAWRALMTFEVNRSRAMLLAGAPLALRLPGRVGWELRLIVQGGLRILEKIEQVDYDIFRNRPQLTKKDWLLMGWRALRMKAAYLSSEKQA